MSKNKSAKAAKPSKPDVLTKVKDAAITKPAQTIKSKSKELAKQVAGKEDKKDKKNKKKAKEPSPEPSESDDSDSSESSEGSGSESEAEPAKSVATNGKTNGAKKSAPKDESSDDSASDSEAEAPKANGAAKKTDVVKEKANASSDESDSDNDSSDGSSEDEKPAEKVAAKPVEAKATKNDPESDGSEDNSDSSDESDKEEVAAKSAKRKAEDKPEQAAKKTKTEALDTSKGANLFVGNLSWNVDEAWLREVFEEFGELSGVRIMTDRATGRSKGFGYVEFVEPEAAAKAHQAKAGADLDGRSLNVDFANARPDNSQKQENRRKSYGDQVSEPSDTLFLGNLSFEVGQETVTEAFAPHGTILGIRLPTDRETGQPKGFGYVTFSSLDESKAAYEAMQGAYIEGRPVRLDYSQPRPQNSDSPARGRGGFGGRGGGGRGGRGGRGGSFGGRGGRGGRGGSTNRGGFGDFSGRKTSFD